MHTTEYLQGLLDRLRAGDVAARDALLERSFERLRNQARKMFRAKEDLRAFDQTDDVLSKGLIRLHKALSEVCPDTVAGYIGLAGYHIRFVLRDLVREHKGSHRVTYTDELPEPANRAEPSDPASWGEFHEAIERLSDEDRQMFDLLVYEQMEQAEAAEALGIPLRTFKRRWQQARLRLHELLK